MIREFYDMIHNECEKLKEQQDHNRTLRLELTFAESDFSRIENKHPTEPNFFAKTFKTNKYNKYQKYLEEFNDKKQRYELLKQQVDKLESDEEIAAKIDEIRKPLDEYLETQNLQVIIDYFIEHDLPLIITEDDLNRIKMIIDREYDADKGEIKSRKIEKPEDVMLVHRTNFYPKNDVIDSRLSSNVVDLGNIEICGKRYDINKRPRRNTVHFAANHEVTGHMGGDWTNQKYSVIVPLGTIPKEQFGSNNCVDTFTDGPVKLDGNCFIICPKEEMDIVKKQNPEAMVIGCDGKTAHEYANALVWGLGYPIEFANEWGFHNTERQNEYYRTLEKFGYTKFAHHSSSKYKDIENGWINVSFVVGILELIINNKELLDIDTNTILNETELEKLWLGFVPPKEYLEFVKYDINEIRDKVLGLLKVYLEEIGYDKEFIEEKVLVKGNSNKDVCILLINEAKKMNKTMNKTL